MLIWLPVDGHILIEGAPGLAKTWAAKLLTLTFDLSFARIQCAPELMHANVTGAQIRRRLLRRIACAHLSISSPRAR